VIRIDDASLDELSKKLEHICRGTQMASGTVVAISSLSHLARTGLAGYCEDLVEVLARIKKAFEGHVRPVNCIIMPGSEIKDYLLVRQVT